MSEVQFADISRLTIVDDDDTNQRGLPHLAPRQAVDRAGAFEGAAFRRGRGGRGWCRRRGAGRLRWSRPGAGRGGRTCGGPGFRRSVGSDVILRGLGKVGVCAAARVGPRQAQAELTRRLRLGLRQRWTWTRAAKPASRPPVARGNGRLDAKGKALGLVDASSWWYKSGGRVTTPILRDKRCVR